MSECHGRTIRKNKRLRAHVDYDGMSVSYGRVKLGVPCGFKEMLEAVTKEILREQPVNIPAFLAAYFSQLLENQQTGSALATLVTERIVEVKPELKTAEMQCQADEARPETAPASEQTDPVQANTIELQTESTKTESVEQGTQKEPSEEAEEKTEEKAEEKTEEKAETPAEKRHCSDTVMECAKETVRRKSESVPTVAKSVSHAGNLDCEIPLNDDKSHVSVNSISDLPPMKMVSCDLILKTSAEDLAIELEDTEDAESENRAVKQANDAANRQQQVEASADDGTTQAKIINQTTQEVQVMSLEQQDANHYEYVEDGDEEMEEPAGQPSQSSVTRQESVMSTHAYCPDEEEPLEDVAHLRPSVQQEEGGLSLEQQANIEYEEEEPKPVVVDSVSDFARCSAKEEQVSEEQAEEEPVEETAVEEAASAESVEATTETVEETSASPKEGEASDELAEPTTVEEQAQVHDGEPNEGSNSQEDSS